MDNSKLRVSELDFESIKRNFKEFLKTQGEFADYDFEASGMSILLDVLSYNTYYNSVMANFLANETYLDTAQMRNSVVSLAKALGYKPKTAKAAKAKLSMTMTNVTGNPSQLVMKAGTPFETTVKNNSFQFVTLNDYVAYNNGGIFTFPEFYVYEGNFFQYSYIAEGKAVEKFTIPNSNVDISSIRVIVQQSESNLNYEFWSYADNVVDINENSKVFFVQEAANQKLEIYFGDGVIGKKISAGNVIIVTYMTTSGSIANGAKVFKLTGSVEGNTVASVFTIEEASSGADAEDIESIKFNAMNYFGAQNRCVTANDYKAIIMQNFANVKSCITWGGEDNIPPQYGKIFICIQPESSEFLTNTEKKDIADILKKRAVSGIKPIFMDPEYFDLEVAVNVVYDPLKNNKTIIELKNLIESKIADYASIYLGKFDSTFRYSQLSRLIDQTDFSILNNTMIIKSYKSLIPTLKTYNRLNFNVYNEIAAEAGAISSTGFYIDEVSEKVYLNNDENGNLFLSYYSESGEFKKYNNLKGKVDFVNGIIVFDNFIINDYDGSEIRIYFKLKNRDIYSKFNSIVRIPLTNISVVVTPESR